MESSDNLQVSLPRCRDLVEIHYGTLKADRWLLLLLLLVSRRNENQSCYVAFKFLTECPGVLAVNSTPLEGGGARDGISGKLVSAGDGIFSEIRREI